jgi:ribosomal RNA-processing protein 9
MCELKLVHGKSATGDANWITAIATLHNSDLIASGSCDGYVRVWKMERNREIKLKFEIPVQGFVNSLVFSSDGERLIAGVGQEHRLGRWWRLKDAKNNVLVIPLKRK